MKALLGLALLSALIAAVPATAKADPPVRVTACEPSSNIMGLQTVRFFPQPWTWAMGADFDGRSMGPYYTPMVDYSGSSSPFLPSNNPVLALDYINQSANAIKSIEFGLEMHGSLVANIWDSGMFSPDVEIRHGFSLPKLWIGSGHFACIPLMVRFSDGTTWNNPDRH